MASDLHPRVSRAVWHYVVALVLVALALAVLDALAGGFRAGRVAWFDLDRERNLPTWFSGTVLFALGAAALCAWAVERQANRDHPGTFRAPVLWLAVAALGWAMSFDEIAIIHENLFWKEVRLASDRLGGAWVFLTQWQVLLAPAVLVATGFMVLFFWNRYRASPVALRCAAAGLACWIAAFSLEGVRAAFRVSGDAWYDAEVMAEELMEMIGAILLAASISFYAVDVALDLGPQRRERLAAAARFLTPRSLAALAVAIGVLLCSAGVMYAVARHLAGSGAEEPALQRRARAEARRVETPATPAARSDAAEADDAADLATGYLVRQCGPDGQFTYRINLDPAVTPQPRYNVLRHAGAVYALAEAWRRRPDEAPRAAALRAAAFLHERCIGPVPGHDELRAVWSDPELNGSGDPLQAKLGGTGLGLVALASVAPMSDTPPPLADLQAMGRFLVFMQKPDGSFYSKYFPADGGRNDDWTSLYYPGEAALGLLMLHGLDGSPEWLDAARRALEHLAQKRRGAPIVPADHWALLATEALLVIEGGAIPEASRTSLVEHAAQITRSMLAEQVIDSDDARLRGGFASDGRTTPTATRLEGLMAARVILSAHDPALCARIDQAVPLGVAFLLRAQLPTGEHAGAIPRAMTRFPAADSRGGDAFNARATEVRIDYVQHALCVFLRAAGDEPAAKRPGTGSE